MKFLCPLLLVLVSGLAFAETASGDNSKPDFFTYHADGTVKTRGVYETEKSGRVVKFTVFDGSGQVLYTEVPYYAGDGRLVRGDRFDANGELEQVVVYFESFAKVLDPTGKVIDTQGYSERKFLETSK